MSKLAAMLYCILRSDPILEHEAYKVIGIDWPGNPYRAHERCIEADPRRWREIGRDAVPPEPTPDENPVEPT